MSVRRVLAEIVFVMAAVVLWPTQALTFDPVYIFSDPLRSLPEVVEKGVILPGDSIPIPQTAQKDYSQPLTLSEAVDLALSNNQNVKSAWADIKIRAAALGQSYATYLPVINGSINWANDNLHYSDPQYPSTSVNSYTYQASATWRIFDFGGRAASRHTSENLLAAAYATYNATLQDALARVAQAYFNAMIASASLEAKAKSEEVAQSTQNSAQNREFRGAVSQLDTLRATTALARASLEKNRALGYYQKALAVLKYYIGAPAKTVLTLPSELKEKQDGVIESKELSLWLEEAQKNHPSIIAAKEQLEAAKEQMAVTKSAGLPTLDLLGNYYQNARQGVTVSPGARETTFTIALSIPFFDGFASTYKLRSAQAQIEKDTVSMADTEQQVALGIIKAHADTNSALRNLSASAELLESAQSALAASQRRYDKDAADITEVLSTQSALADAWNERVRALAEWHSARLQLLAGAGQMGRFAVAGFSTGTGHDVPK